MTRVTVQSKQVLLLQLILFFTLSSFTDSLYVKSWSSTFKKSWWHFPFYLNLFLCLNLLEKPRLYVKKFPVKDCLCVFLLLLLLFCYLLTSMCIIVNVQKETRFFSDHTVTSMTYMRYKQKQSFAKIYFLFLVNLSLTMCVGAAHTHIYI